MPSTPLIATDAPLDRPHRPRSKRGEERSAGLRERLARDLPIIDEEGWDAPVGEALLVDLRENLVGPATASIPIRSGARPQAEAYAWQKVWQALATGSVRDATNPWSALWTVARRAVQDETAATLMLTSARKAWRVTEPDAALVSVGIDCGRTWLEHESLESNLEDGADYPDQPAPVQDEQLGWRLDLIVDALVDIGWEKVTARAVLKALAEIDGGRPDRGRPGWRPIARKTGVAPWIARRVQLLVLGHGPWPGLLERVVVEGAYVLAEPAVTAALASTVRRNDPSPEATIARWSSSSRELRTQDLRPAS